MSLRAGIYPARAVPMVTDDGEVACRFGESAKKSTPFVHVLCQVIRGPAAGQTITYQGYFTGGATEHTIKALRNFGFTGDDLAAMPEQRPENEVSIVVSMSEPDDRGRQWPKVDWVNSPNRGMRIESPIQGPDLRKFSAQFKAHLKTAPVIKGAKATLEAPSEDAGEVVGGGLTGGSDWERGAHPPRDDEGPPPRHASDDDIPF